MATTTGTARKKTPALVEGSFFSEIVKTSKDAATGNLMVYGKCTGSDLDLDGQRMDPEFLKRAMPEWLPFGNVREQHSKVAAGVGRELTQDGTDWYLKAEIVDPVTIRKVEAGVLKGFSINVRDAEVSKSAAAPNGVIGGPKAYIGEISVVDRPCLPSATMAICKSASADGELEAEDAPPVDPGQVDDEGDPFEDEDDIEPDDADGDGPAPTEDDAVTKAVEAATRPLLERIEALAQMVELNKRDFSQDQRDRLADTGAAMPDGSFPISSKEDLENAVHLVGHAHDPAAAKAHIRKRAAALGLADPFDADKVLGAAGVDSIDKAVGGGVPSDAITKAVNEAVTGLGKALGARIDDLAASVQKVMAMPLPGAPVLMGRDPREARTQTGPASRRGEFLEKAANATDPAAKRLWELNAANEPAA